MWTVPVCAQAKENYLSGLKKHDLERQDLIGERELIKEIMRFIGVLHDVKATEKSIAAGGRDSIKDEVRAFLCVFCSVFPFVGVLMR